MGKSDKAKDKKPANPSAGSKGRKKKKDAKPEPETPIHDVDASSESSAEESGGELEEEGKDKKFILECAPRSCFLSSNHPDRLRSQLDR